METRENEGKGREGKQKETRHDGIYRRKEKEVRGKERVKTKREGRKEKRKRKEVRTGRTRLKR